MTGTPALTFRIQSAGAADIGLGRKHNEDAVLLRPDLQLYLLADGAGGHGAGNIASSLALTTIAHAFEESEAEVAERPEFDNFGIAKGVKRLGSAMQRANAEIIEIARLHNKFKGMGTTVVAVHLSLTTGLLHVGHVGDSRCYRLRHDAIEALTYDHTLINEVLEMRPELGEQELANLPRHVITRALGMEVGVRTPVRSHVVLSGDRYLLCSDGLHGVVPEAVIGEVLAANSTPEECVSRLVHAAKELGTRDNVAAVVLFCEASPDGLARHSAGPFVEPAALGSAALRPNFERPDGGSTDEDDPEILVLDEDEDGSEPHYHVVPPQAANPSLLQALDRVIDPRHRPGGRPRSK